MADSPVYIGTWVNWTKGSVLGSTVTISADHGAYLVAFLALFVRWAGAHLWSIICFCLHQWRSTPEERDGLYHQQQAVLRNALSDSSVLWFLTKLGWNWKNNTHGAIRRNVPLMIITVSHMIIFAICGIFSSRVTSVGDEVLIRSPICGWTEELRALSLGDTYNQHDYDIADALYTTAHSTLQKGSSYARQCYGESASNWGSICSTYAQPRINSQVDGKAQCPFPDGVCNTTNAFSVDSGYIDSDSHLGINMPPGDRVKYRKVTTCAPIDADNRYSTWTTDGWSNVTLPKVFERIEGNTYVYYDMGYNYMWGTNFTFSYSNFSFLTSTEPYTLKGYSAFSGATDLHDFEPIDDFHKEDADVTLLSLTNNARYTEEVMDPWFRANIERANRDIGVEDDAWLWYPNTIQSVLACTEQYQFCNGDICTPLTGLFNVNSTVNPDLHFNQNQMATYKVLWRAVRDSRLQHILFMLKSRALVAPDFLWGSNFVSSKLSDNQWEIEVQNLQNVSMALTQRRVVEYASPPDIEIRAGTRSTEYVITPQASDELKMCSSQKIRSTAFSSFSVVGLCIIMGGGTVIILLNCWLTDIVHWVMKSTGKGHYQRLEWIEGETLQLQRMAFEGRGVTDWKGRDACVPVTTIFAHKFPMPTPWSAPAVAAPVVQQYEQKSHPQQGYTYSAVPVDTPMMTDQMSPPPAYGGQQAYFGRQ
ncbi:hypothetical protein W97_08482 [Coniosporium apollinis CBS 100218]|uniref:Uncharacterized protein n=1 Tax=Coniosporium apollinis (strain CBS 100218) TaxID=1168221 RepID=R7Z544_CONA1|nr:uncharacterized protein W97_08482 [Coniosporium apollinis CBS 100218]EON69223.1 hypothetical protein W97_08482 [Coniosporium apollinis CBS 100218]